MDSVTTSVVIPEFTAFVTEPTMTITRELVKVLWQDMYIDSYDEKGIYDAAKARLGITDPLQKVFRPITNQNSFLYKPYYHVAYKV
jgi:hypothetical protein